MDSSVLYGWRDHNYVFDTNVNKYVLQHRTTTTTDASRYDEPESLRTDDRNPPCIDTPIERDATRSSSIDRTDAIHVHTRPSTSVDNKHKKRKWTSTYKLKPSKSISHESIQAPIVPRIPSITSNHYTILTQHNIRLILCNWYRVFCPQQEHLHIQSVRYLRKTTNPLFY
eukprot:280864_1